MPWSSKAPLVPRAAKPALLFRVGINVGDVIAEDSDIYGTSREPRRAAGAAGGPWGILILELRI